MKPTLVLITYVKTKVNDLTRRLRLTPLTGYLLSVIIGMILTDMAAYGTTAKDSSNTRLE